MEERDRLRDLVEQVRNHLEIRDDRIRELEEQLQRVMSGHRSVSAEHEYLTEQIEELKRRLVDRNREYEALRRRERRLHREVFDRDERIAPPTLHAGNFKLSRKRLSLKIYYALFTDTFVREH